MIRTGAIAALVLGLATAASGQADPPTLRIAVQTSGTVNWEIQTIVENGLDRANGFELEVMDVAGSPAGQVAFLGGEADVIVSDWIWVARQRAEGQNMAIIPYSRAVGGLMVPADSTAQTLADLKGTQIGIAGGPVDKSWIILRALAYEQGFDLAAETTQVFGAPPIIFKAGLDGEVAGVVNFWHFMAKQQAAGMRMLMSVAEASEALGLDPDVPLLGYVVQGDLVRDQPDLVASFAKASREAKNLLASDDAQWERLRPQMNADSDAEFAALVAGWRDGIPAAGPVDQAEVAKLLAVMAELGGEELVGNVTELPEGVFAPLGY
jgi:NitT/TauT family transport system substrate-binding protein